MKVILPNDTSGYVSSVQEDDAPAWDRARSYAEGERCVDHHYIYASIAGGNAGFRPSETCVGIDAKWKKTGVTNQFAMFDAVVNTSTVTAADVERINVDLPFDRATAFAVFRMECTALRASASDAGQSTPFFTRTYDLLRDRRSRWSYRYDAASWIHDLTETEIGVTPRGRLALEFERTGGRCAVGTVVVGRAYDVGRTQFDAEPSIKSYSSVSEDVFGRTTIVERFSAKAVRAEVYVHPAHFDAVFEFLKGVVNKPAVWICDNDDAGMSLESLTTFGYLRAVSGRIQSHSAAVLPIEIMGMI